MSVQVFPTHIHKLVPTSAVPVEFIVGTSETVTRHTTSAGSLDRRPVTADVRTSHNSTTNLPMLDTRVYVRTLDFVDTRLCVDTTLCVNTTLCEHSSVDTTLCEYYTAVWTLKYVWTLHCVDTTLCVDTCPPTFC